MLPSIMRPSRSVGSCGRVGSGTSLGVLMRVTVSRLEFSWYIRWEGGRSSPSRYTPCTFKFKVEHKRNAFWTDEA